MQIQINTDNNIEYSEAIASHIVRKVNDALNRFSDQVTRVEVHLSDVNAKKKSQDDKHCVMEVRLEGRQPIAVTHKGANVYQVADGAADKLARLIENTLGRLHDQKSRRSGPDPKDENPGEE